jgi:hypothetical protein
VVRQGRGPHNTLPARAVLDRQPPGPHRLPIRERQWASTAAWYAKPSPTFSDALAAVRRAIWREQTFLTSLRRGERTKQRLTLPEPWAYALCHAA